MTNPVNELLLKKNLKSVIEAQELSMKDLSSSSQVPLKTIYGWLVGSPPRNLVHLKRVATALNLTIDALAFGNPSSTIENSDFPETVQKFIEFFLKQLATRPEDVRVEVLKNDIQTTFQILLSPEDLSHMNQVHLDHLQSLRKLIGVLADKQGLKSDLKLKVETDKDR